MDLSALNPALLIAALMVAAVPILLAAIGEMVVEKSGVLNLGVEGMMIMGAVCGFAVTMTTGSPVVGFVGAAIGGVVLSLVFALLTQYFLTNQVATGLALTLFGLGLSALIGQGYQGLKPPLTSKLDLGPLSDIPFLGQAVFSHDWVVYFSLFVTVAVWAFLKYSRPGLVLRAVGENHDAAHALGYKIKLIRVAAIAFGGACAGMGGAYISLVRVPQWVDGMTAGAGWIALAIVVFGTWRAGYILIGAYLFGGMTALQLNLQAAGLKFGEILLFFAERAFLAIFAIWVLAKLVGYAKTQWNTITKAATYSLGALILLEVAERGFSFLSNNDVFFLSSSPYLLTIIVLVVISATRSSTSLAAPGSLGRVFHAAS